MKHPAEYTGKEIVIIGLAKSGVGVAKIFHDLGACVIVNDKKERSQCPEADELEALGISVLCGGHPDSLIHKGVCLVVKNPGIPYTAPPVAKASELGIEIVTEVEVAYRLCKAPMIGITGSNGKTTTTTWIGHMLESANLSPIVAGNIGRALCEAAPEAQKEDWLVVELSSFQLKGTQDFRPHIACLLNVVETHLDYHGDMEDYITSKAKLFTNQQEEDFAVVNWNDPVCRQLVVNVKAKVIPFSIKELLDYGVFVQPPLADQDQLGNQHIVYKDEQGREHVILELSNLGIPGQFNAENALAASAVAIAAGVPLSIISQELTTFRGVEHRLEYVATLKEIPYYNNSKATNPMATMKAIEAFSQSIVLIAGGLDRGSDYMELLPLFKQQVKALVALGETKDKLVKVAELAGIRQIYSVDTGEDAEHCLTQAVEQAASIAQSGDIVLLSPACASWDMFTSYEERGRIFKKSVHNL